jgi:hypothetical protein
MPLYFFFNFIDTIPLEWARNETWLIGEVEGEATTTTGDLQMGWLLSSDSSTELITSLIEMDTQYWSITCYLDRPESEIILGGIIDQYVTTIEDCLIEAKFGTNFALNATENIGLIYSGIQLGWNLFGESSPEAQAELTTMFGRAFTLDGRIKTIYGLIETKFGRSFTLSAEAKMVTEAILTCLIGRSLTLEADANQIYGLIEYLNGTGWTLLADSNDETALIIMGEPYASSLTATYPDIEVLISAILGRPTRIIQHYRSI